MKMPPPMTLSAGSKMSTNKNAGSWEKNVLPASQKAAALGASAAALWKSNAANNMTLPTHMAAADADGDGTIDYAEFKELLANSGGATADMAALYAKLDKDGDGELTQQEIAALLDAKRNHFKAQA